MKGQLCKVCLLIILLQYGSSAFAQVQWLDSLTKLVQSEKEDTDKVKNLVALAQYYANFHADTGIIYSRQALDLAVGKRI